MSAQGRLMMHTPVNIKSLVERSIGTLAERVNGRLHCSQSDLPTINTIFK